MTNYFFQGPSSGGGGGSPTGSAGGDLSGTYPNPTVATAGTHTIVTTSDTGSVTNTMLAGSVAYSKLSLTGAVLNADLAGSIAASKVTGTALVASNNLSDVTAATARTNLGLGTAATQASTAFASAAGTVGGPPLIVYRSSDATAINSGTTGTTLTSDSVLTFNVSTSSDVWWVEAFMVVSAVNTAMDFKAAFAIPTSWTGSAGALNQVNSNIVAWGGTTTGNTPVALQAPTGAIAAGSGNLTFGCSIGAVIIGDASHTGAIALQIAQNTADAGNLVLKAGSFLRAQRLA